MRQKHFSQNNLRMTMIGAAFAAICFQVGAADASSHEKTFAKADLQTVNGENAGVVNLLDTPNGVLVTGELQNLEVGRHGFHIHETGKCEGDFSSAGGHFAPNGNEHGFANEEGYHAGDMPNIFVSDDGLAVFNFFNHQVQLGDGPASINDADGSAIIVHAKHDTYLADAMAGERVACGVIVMDE